MTMTGVTYNHKNGHFWQLDFTGKELDPETGYSYFGARYLDHTPLTLWLSVDPMADKYPSISPYTYCAWNPLKLVDPDGREIDFSILNSAEQSRLVKCLSALTGLSLYINDDNKLMYRTDNNGNAIVIGGSESARMDLIEAIEKKNEDGSNYIIRVGIGIKCEGGQNNNKTGGLIIMFFGRMKESEDCSTNGLGMVFLHELRHAVTGDRDPKDGGDLYIGNKVNVHNFITGPVVDRVNVYREELGMPIRLSYASREDGYVPFCYSRHLMKGTMTIIRNTLWMKIESEAQ